MGLFFYVLRGFSRQLLDPLVAVCLNGCGCALEELVAVQAEQHRCGRPMEDERAKEGEGKHDAPDADQVIDKHKSRVTAAAHDADVDRHLVCRAHARDAKDEQKVLCNGIGFGGKIVKFQDKRADDEQGNTRDRADAKENDLHGLDVFAQLLHVALAHGLADDDACGGCRAHRHDLKHLKQRAGNRVGGNRAVAQVTENDVLQRNRAAENKGHHHEIRAMLVVIAKQGKVGYKKVLLAHAQAFVNENIVQFEYFLYFL